MRDLLRRATIMVIATMFVATTCTSGGGRVQGSTGTLATRPRRGGTLRLAVPDAWAETIALDPGAYYNETWELARCCLLRTLYSYNGRRADEGGAQVRPDLAEGMPQVSSDGLTWTFRLKAGLRYAPPFDNTPIVALDIVRAVEREARVDSRYSYYFSVIRGFDDYPDAANSIVGLEAQDDRTLVVRLNQLTGDLAYRFSFPATAPIPEGASDDHDADYGRFLVASGPYMVEGSRDLDFSAPPERQEPASGFAPAQVGKHGVLEKPGSLVLVRNPSWDPGTDPLRPAYADRIEIAIGGGDAEAIAGQVNASKVDLVFVRNGSPFDQVARYREDPALKDRLHVDARDAGYAITMNLATPPFDDVHVRRAVNLAIDSTSLVDLLSRPPHQPENGSAEAGSHIAPDVIEGLLLRAFDPYRYDPAAAREEMRDSAYDRTGDGVCDAPVCRSVRALVWDIGVIPKQAHMVRDELAQLGIDLRLDIRSQNKFFSLGNDPSRKIPMTIAFPWGQDYPEGTGWFLGLFDSSGLVGPDNPYLINTSLVGATPAQLREWGYGVTSVPSVDDRFNACEERRGVARTQCWAELDQYLMTEVVPRVPYMFIQFAEVVSERVIDYSFDQFQSLPALDRIAIAPGSD